ncbi:hypothetical protein AGABI1DRAFT_132447 [Agaricus bisporus var. burnettii JB137-S8]|uniref:Uncharacterized protein n=1 Tax=Agaricus bisporus var. burnettii (strain JB137-S8 / ATCC MYA-4627 / FGSC 10392) TaxID=597362 RepID=K5WX97_AGABU|nr:uncharacterized protein AGABI1DRAFT_132447 [Agaricus bisporus var. burnettii JB137-S8]EKM75197.1 hypothetical protein AGABI1DRAFT_132447 [Agaricus bisporus var. burnettii JB137-S8]
MSANPPLQGVLLLATQLELVSGTTAGGTLYGIAFSLYCLYLHASLPQLRDHDRRRTTQFMIISSSIIMLCGFYFLLLNAWVIQDAYIKHANFPKGPYGYEDSTFNPDMALMGSLVWQQICPIGYNNPRPVFFGLHRQVTQCLLSAPRLKSTPSSLALSIRKLFFQVTLTVHSDLIKQVWKPQNAEYALHAIFTILPTIIIAGFLIIHDRRQRKLMGRFQLSTPYINVVAMLIESYAMESTWIILTVIVVNLKDPMTLFFGDTLAYIKVNGYIAIILLPDFDCEPLMIKIIAHLLVLYRVANGRAYGSQSRRDCITSLHWNHTTGQSVAAGGIDTNIRPPAENKIEPDILLVQSSPA